MNEGCDNFIGKQIKGYTILHKLGGGGSACVYLAENPLHQQVAIKLLEPKYLKSEVEQLFLQEAHFLQELKHYTHILPILHHGKNKGIPYIGLAYMAGGTLRERINVSGSLAIEEALAIIIQIGEAVHTVHQHDIVHNDLKPENILFRAEDNVVLADFGLAIALKKNAQAAHYPCGTYAYMPPERFERVFSKAGDQYALGCIAYELLTGLHPFEGALAFDPHDCEKMKVLHKEAKPPSLREFNSAIPDYIEQAIAQAMAKDPKERHATIPIFMQKLQWPVAKKRRSAYSATYTLDTPTPSILVLENAPAPIHPLDQAKALDTNPEVARLEVHATQLQVIDHDRNINMSPAHDDLENIVPVNTEGKKEGKKTEQRNTEYPDPFTPEVGGTKRTRRPPDNPFKTRDLQLKEEIYAPLTMLLKDQELTLVEKIIPAHDFRKPWQCTTIYTKNTPIPQYALVYIPCKFLEKGDIENDDYLRRIFPIFENYTLIIFSDSKRDSSSSIKSLIEFEAKDKWAITISVIKQNDINVIKSIQNSEPEIRRIWIDRYLNKKNALYSSNVEGEKQSQRSKLDHTVKIKKIDEYKLRKAMEQAYNLAELAGLCAHIQQELHKTGDSSTIVSFEVIGGNGGLDIKILQLVEYLKRNQCLDFLVQVLREERPRLDLE